MVKGSSPFNPLGKQANPGGKPAGICRFPPICAPFATHIQSKQDMLEKNRELIEHNRDVRQSAEERMSQPFDYDIRVLLCPQCGGPIETKPEGGLFTCGFCGVKMMLGSRLGQAPAPDPAKATPPEAADESRRLDLLRAQDGKPLLPPPNLRYLMSLGQLSADHLELALKEWRAARERLIVQPTAADAEQMYFLTLMLYQYYSGKQEVLRTRALLETASEMLAHSRYLDIVRCMLSRAAANTKDLEAAAQWLRLCNDRSADLWSDTEYRFSAAHLATINKQWPEVLRLLGLDLTTIPIADSSDAVCGLLRANALENTGQTERAKIQIEQLASKATIGVKTLAHIMERYQNLGIPLCEKSYAPLTEEMKAAPRSMIPVMLRIVFRVVFPLVGIGALVVHFVTLPFLPIGEDLRQATLGIGITLLVTSLALLFPGLLIRRFLGPSGDRERILKEGISGKAEIVTITPTNWKINDVPQYKFDLLITLPNQGPFRASQKLLMSPEQEPHFQPGVTIGVKADPKNPKNFILLM